MVVPHEHNALTSREQELVRQVGVFVEFYFDDPKYDASHDFEHVLRVTTTAIHILDLEQNHRATSDQAPLNALTVILGALLHDVSDKKYHITDAHTNSVVVESLLTYGLEASYADMINELVEGVSYSSEVNNPKKVQDLIARIPELAIVQDADRLDAIGAIGIGRCFTYGGAKSTRRLSDSIDHFRDKLLKLEGMMKTATGKAMAVDRGRRIREFMKWWEDEDCMVIPTLGVSVKA